MTTTRQTRSTASVHRICILIAAIVLVSTAAHAQDEFTDITCSSDIPRLLLGKSLLNEPVSKTQARHKDLALEDLGADMLTDHLALINWRICGKEYAMLADTKIRDVMLFPPHSPTNPMSIGSCQLNGTLLPGTIAAVLDNRGGISARNPANADKLLNATAAWRIDPRSAKFEPMPTQNLLCRLGDINTADGGP
jgi:hypothetical protein